MDSTTKYLKVASYEAHKGTFDRCLLLYSGGLDTSVMLKWIQVEYSCQVVALTIDIGQTADDLNAIKDKALKLGAVDCIVYDAKEEFANSLLSEAIKANADYQGGYALGCPLGRVMISQIAARVAAQYHCQVVAHGCTGKGNDQVRFEGYILTLDPSLKIIAPVREWGMGREEEIEYAAQHNIPVKQKKDSPYSYDENMWSVEQRTHAHTHTPHTPPAPRLVCVELNPGDSIDPPDILHPLNADVHSILEDVLALVHQDDPSAHHRFLDQIDDGCEWWDVLHQLWAHHHLGIVRHGRGYAPLDKKHIIAQRRRLMVCWWLYLTHQYEMRCQYLPCSKAIELAPWTGQPLRDPVDYGPGGRGHRDGDATRHASSASCSPPTRLWQTSWQSWSRLYQLMATYSRAKRWCAIPPCTLSRRPSTSTPSSERSAADRRSTSTPTRTAA